MTQYESSASPLSEPQISQWRELFAVLQVDGDRSIPLALYNKLWCDRGTMFISHLEKPRSHPSRTEIFNVHSFETIRQSLRVMLALYHRDSQTRGPAATGRQIIHLSIYGHCLLIRLSVTSLNRSVIWNNVIEQIPSWEADSDLVAEENTRLSYGTRRFSIVFTVHHRYYCSAYSPMDFFKHSL